MKTPTTCKSPASTVAQTELGMERTRLGHGNVSLETIPGESEYAKFAGGITKILIKEKDNYGDILKYFFTFNNRHYAVTAYIPYGPDDNRLYFKQDRQISAETTKEMNERTLELLRNLEKL